MLKQKRLSPFKNKTKKHNTVYVKLKNYEKGTHIIICNNKGKEIHFIGRLGISDNDSVGLYIAESPGVVFSRKWKI